MPAADSYDLLAYGEDLVDLMLAHYGVEQPAETKYTKEALISPTYLSSQKNFVFTVNRAQHKQCAENHVPKHQHPGKHISKPVSTASVESSFSQMKLIKTRIRNQIGQSSLS